MRLRPTPCRPSPVVVYVPDIDDSSAELVIDPDFVLFVVSRTLAHIFTTKFTKAAKKKRKSCASSGLIVRYR